MTEYPNSSHINTIGNVVEVGEQYQYSEDGMIADVEVVADTSTDEYMEFFVKVLNILCLSMWGKGVGPQEGETFTLGATRGPGAYNGMWRLWKKDEYVKLPVMINKEKVKEHD